MERKGSGLSKKRKESEEEKAWKKRKKGEDKKFEQAQLKEWFDSDKSTKKPQVRHIKTTIGKKVVFERGK